MKGKNNKGKKKSQVFMYRKGLLPRSSLDLRLLTLRVVAPKCVSLNLVEACESRHSIA